MINAGKSYIKHIGIGTMKIFKMWLVLWLWLVLSIHIGGMVWSQNTERVSVDSFGVEGNQRSFFPSISSDGRYVAFYSYASNLVANDTNDKSDIFVHDRDTGTTTRVSAHSSSAEGNASSLRASISSDGRYVTFNSAAFNLVDSDTNGYRDVFVHDRQTNTTTRVSVDSNGAQGNNYSLDPCISSDGRYVAFYSLASNLVANDTNSIDDIFVHDRQTKTTTRVSVDSSGEEGNHYSDIPSISTYGRYVAFASQASNLVVGDTNAHRDIFVHAYQGSFAQVPSLLILLFP